MTLFKVSKYTLVITLFTVCATLLLTFHELSSKADSETVEDIEAQINDQQNKLENTKNEIDSLQNQLASASSELEGAAEGIPKIEAELKEIETQLEINKKKFQLLEEANELKTFEKKKIEALQNDSVYDTYKIWKFEENVYGSFFNSRTDFKRAEYYSQTLFGFGNELVSNLNSELQELQLELGDSEQSLALLEQQSEELNKKKADLEVEIQRLNSVIAQSSNSVAGLKTKQESLENTLNSLLAEQQEAAQREADILENTPPANPPSDPGETDPGGEGGIIKFSGKGRDLYQGHGVGMSQWGAYGAGKAGKSANEILAFYYANTRIETRDTNINVQGYGTMSNDTYVAGLGEVPDKACGNSSQVSSRPDKYVLDNPSTAWDCWPEEAIKAQVIAARSYAIRYGGTICTTAACQVYNGGTGKQWAADETSKQVVVSSGSTHNNQVIEALYSSDNSQGSGTANNDTIFQNFSGDGTPYSYLRAVNDSSFATPTSWTNWSYQTGSYSYQSIWNMLNYTANNPASSASGSTKNSVRNMMSGTNGVTGLSFERDNSGRVKKVWVTFDNNVVKSIGGWWFKNVWNNWAYDIATYDYIYSQTFYLI